MKITYTYTYLFLYLFLYQTALTLQQEPNQQLRQDLFHTFQLNRQRHDRNQHNNQNQREGNRHLHNDQQSSFNKRQDKERQSNNQHRHHKRDQQSTIQTITQSSGSQLIQENPSILSLQTVASQQSQTILQNHHIPQDQTQQIVHQQQQSHYHQWHQIQFWRNVLIAGVLCCVGGFCSGMTVGLMSIQTIQLQIMSLSQDQQQKKIAQRILSVVSNHHMFLVTLLLANAIALESLPLVVHTLMPAWAAILFSTFIVLIVAQIVPQAFCTGPKKITIAYHASPIILGMQKFFWILAYPMAKGLDYLLGEHHHQRIQHKDFANFLTGGSQNLKNTQKLLLTSILQLRTKRVPQIMVSISDLYMLSLTQKLTASKIKQINKKDYSYILIYKDTRSNVVGVIKTKQFAIKYLKFQKKNITVQDFFVEKQDILCVYQDTNLLQMLMLFQARTQRYSIVIGKKRKIQPGVQSIMYSKSDMVANNQQGQVLGVVFLYKIFEMITEHDNQVANVLNMGNLLQSGPDKGVHNTQKIGHKQVEMSQMNKPLLPK